MSSDVEPEQQVDQSDKDARLAAVYDPASYVVQGSAITPRHKRDDSQRPAPVSASADSPPRTIELEPEPKSPPSEMWLPEQIADQIASDVVETAAHEDPVDHELHIEEKEVIEPVVTEDSAERHEVTRPGRLALRGPRRINETAAFRAREYEAVHAERRASMTRRSQVLAFGIAGIAVLLGGAAVGSGLSGSRSLLVGVFCFGAPLLVQLVVSAWLEESIRAVRAQDYLIALEEAINEHLAHRSLGFESWLRRPHARLELPYRWVIDFAVILSVAVAVIGWKSAALSGIDFLWAVVVPGIIAGSGRYWAERTLKQLESESRRRITLEP